MITDQCLYKYKNISIFRKRAMKKILDSMERFLKAGILVKAQSYFTRDGDTLRNLPFS